MAENKIEQIKELADWVKDNNEAIKKEGKSIIIGVFEETDKGAESALSVVSTPIALMVWHEKLEECIKENADDLLKYFLAQMIMED